MEEQKKTSAQILSAGKALFIDLKNGDIETVSSDEITHNDAAENSGKLEFSETNPEAVENIKKYADEIEESSRILDEMKKSVSKN